MTTALVDEHLKKFHAQQRSILFDLRKMISMELPSASEVIRYGIPTFMISDIPVIGFEGFKNHNSIFPYSGAINSILKKELAGFEQTKGSIHFEPYERFPRALLKKILKTRVDLLNASYPKKGGQFLEFYSSGVLKASGKMKNGLMHSDWKWFRKDGVIMRSGSFKLGEQTGEWITYDRAGNIYKKTLCGGPSQNLKPVITLRKW